MDSKTINKLIRSEIWPLLRGSGFSHFEARNAFAYRGHFINVVNFQSFNSYLAEGLGCTTFSFAVNLGVYVIGQPGEVRLPRDKAGRLSPREYHCAFRSILHKRTPVDGFARGEIFFIDPSGRTTASCFDELRHLVTNFLPDWFEQRNNVDRLIAGMNSESESAQRVLCCPGVPGSYVWNELSSLLMLLRHDQRPSEESSIAALEHVDRMIGTILDFSTIQSGRPREEMYAIKVRELWDHFGAFSPNAECCQASSNEGSRLPGPVWAAMPDQQGEPEDSGTSSEEIISARRDLWPILTRAGFSEFTDRLAHRVSDGFVEVVEFLPMDSMERKAWKHPPGMFRIGLGLFWNDLGEDRLFRRDRIGNPRPVANECHISNWLTPANRIDRHARTAFDSAREASAALSVEGLGWLDLVRDPSAATSMLERANWELFFCFPMMRGYGAKGSPRRFAYLAQCARMLSQNNQAQSYLRTAESAIDNWGPEHLRPRERSWIAGIRERMAANSGR